MGTLGLNQVPLVMERPQVAAYPSVRHARNSASGGFTFFELLIVLSIILVLMSVGVPILVSAQDQARTARAVSEIHTIEDEITYYETLNGKLPDDLSQVGFGGYLDPWGVPYQYLNHADDMGNGIARKDQFNVLLNSDYDLYSMGKDQQTADAITDQVSQDDIIRASNGTYAGLASQF
jgi:general secretion pathway protein G